MDCWEGESIFLSWVPQAGLVIFGMASYVYYFVISSVSNSKYFEVKWACFMFSSVCCSASVYS